MKKKILLFLLMFVPMFVMADTKKEWGKIDAYDIDTEVYVSSNIWISSKMHMDHKYVDTLLDSNGNIHLVYYKYPGGDTVYIQKLDKNYNPTTLLSIKMLYPKYGTTVMDSEGNYYIAWGQDDSKDLNTGVITFAISKYDNNGNFIKSYTVDNSANTGGTWELFYSGGINMTINKNGILAYNYSHNMKNTHQANEIGYVDTKTMTKANNYNTHPYTSHAMYTDVINTKNNDEFVFIQQGDASRRGYNLSLIYYDSSTKKYLNASSVPFHFSEGGNAYNYTFASYGGIEYLNTGILLGASSLKELYLSPFSPENTYSQNVFYQIIKRDALNNKLNANSFVTSGIRNATGSHDSSSSHNYL